MKRTFAFIFACLLLFTTSVGVLADDDDVYPVTEIYEHGYLLDEDDRYVDFDAPADDDSVPYGETIYYPLLSDSGSGNLVGVYQSTATKSIKIKTDWEEGSSYIDKLAVVKKRFTGSLGSGIDLSASNYCYFLSITTKTRSSTTTATHDVYGTVEMRKSSGDSEYRFDYEDVFLDVSFEVGYNAPEDANVIPIIPALFIPEEDFDEYDDETFDFEADSYSYFVVNTNNQKKIVLGMDTDYDDDIADQYPNANLDFFNGNGAAFNRIGYLYLYADRDNYVYEVQDDDTLKKVNASYDSYDDTFVIRTRTLGRYVISDRKLNIPDPRTDNSDEDTAVIYDNDTQTNYNPGTGGFGFDDIAYGTQAAPKPAAVQNTVSTAPAVANDAASVNPSSAPSSQQGDKQQAEDDSPTIIGTTKKAANNLAEPSMAAPPANSDTNAASPDYRKLAMIVCSIGVALSVIGLLICGLISFNRSRQKYY